MSNEKERTPSAAIALKDRDEGMIRKALEAQTEEVQDAAVRLWEYARKENCGQTTLAHRMNISSSVISQFFNGTYAGNFENIAAHVATFFFRLEQQELYGGIRKFVDTSLSKALWTVAEKTRIIRRIQIIQGPEQVGKTRALDEYTHRNNSGRTIHVKVSGGRAGLADFVNNLCSQVGIPYTIKTAEKRLRLRECLEICDLLIIDEMHLVRQWPDKAQRDFWDYLRTDLFDDGSRGVLLIYTNEDAIKRLAEFKRRSGYNVGQLLGRMRMEVLQIDPADDIAESDIRALTERYYKPGVNVVRRLYAMATREQLGHLGLVNDVLNEAWNTAKGRKDAMADDHVNRTIDRIMDTLKSRKELL